MNPTLRDLESYPTPLHHMLIFFIRNHNYAQTFYSPFSFLESNVIYSLSYINVQDRVFKLFDMAKI